MPGAIRPRFSAALLAPRHWPAWLGAGVTWLLAHLPWALLHRLGRGLGHITAHIHNRRWKTAKRNIELCFPELDDNEQTALLNRHMRALGMMPVEFALGWLGSTRGVDRVPVHIEGLEHLRAARAAGRGVLLVGAHFTHLELCLRMVSHRIPIAAMYRRMDSVVFEWLVLRARLGYADAMFDKYDLRGTVKYLRAGGTVWYAPDQDMGGKDHVFVPFFGVPAATITGTHQLARMGRACVIPFFHRREDDGSYTLRLEAPLTDFPGDDATADTARVSRLVEHMVREAPEQYLWVHKRFKTRPPGTRDVYAHVQTHVPSLESRDQGPGTGDRPPRG